MSVQQQQNSIITQVAPEGSGLAAGGGDLLEEQLSPDSIIRLELRGVEFEITRHEMMRLPESILLGISNGLVPDGQMLPHLSEVETASVNFSPECLQYTLDTFRKVTEDVDVAAPTTSTEQSQQPEEESDSFIHTSIALKKSRRAVIVLREDLDYYCIPIGRIVSEQKMQQIKRNCGEIIVNQKKIFSGLRNSDEPGSAEQHLIDMLCSSGFDIDDEWGFRATEPNKTVISSLSLTRLLTQEPDEKMDETARAEAMMPHKLLLFWRKPARKCWWDSIELHNVKEVDCSVRVHVRRVWTLELSVVR